MLSQLQDVLNVYLFPFVIAVPIAIVLYLLVTRQDEGPQSPTAPAPPERAGRRPAAEPPARHAAPAARMAPASRQFEDAGGPPSVAPSGWVSTMAPPMPAPELQPELAAHLLLVDDSAVARAKLRKLFDAAGYSSDLARDGQEALDLLGKGRYALMITDLEMPNMNGIELIAAVAGSLETEDMPILAITGHDDLQAKVHECQGLFGIFKKPWNDRELLRRVENLVRMQQRASLPGTVGH